jgi:cell division protease FtsH
MNASRRFPLSYVLLALAAGLWLSSLLGPRSQEISYSDFKATLRDDRVEEVLIADNRIEGRLRRDAVASGESPYFHAVVVPDEALVDDLEAHGVAFRGVAPDGFGTFLATTVLPAAIFVGFWVFAMRRFSPQAGVAPLTKSKARVYSQANTGVTFGDVAGQEEAKAELTEVVQFLVEPERFQRLGGKLPRGVLLVGPPGTGKTMLAKAVAGEAKSPFFSISGSEFVELFVGMGAARVRDLFEQAKKRAPCIVFIDELDALGKARGASGMVGGHDERENTLNQLLVEMDGFDTNAGIIVLGATNRPEVLDAALLRAGRFDRQVLVDRPDRVGREAILRVHARGVSLAKEVDLAVIAQRTPGFVGADLANLINEAALLAAREGADLVYTRHFNEAVDRVVAGLEKKSRIISPKEKERVAVHEAGHALVAALTPGADPVHKISIIPRGLAALGYTQQLPADDRYLATRDELIGRIDVLLGGRVAEETVFGNVSSGAQNDLQRATDIIRSMITELGMGDTLGALTYGRQGPAFLASGYGGGERQYSDATAMAVDEEMKRIMGERLTHVRELVAGKRDLLDRAAAMLLEKETIEGEDFATLVGTVSAEAPLAPEPTPAQAVA